MTSEREMEALAVLFDQARIAEWERIVEAHGVRPGFDRAASHKASTEAGIAAVIRRLQPARVQEGMSLLVDALEGAMIESLHGEGFDLWAKNRGKFRNRLPENVGAIVVKMRALLAAAPAAEGGMAEAVAWMTDSPYVCNSLTNDKTVADMWRERGWNVAPLGVIDSPAPESREAETMRDFVEEIGTNGKPTGYFIFDKPEAGQREGVDWLGGPWRVSEDAHHIHNDGPDADVMLVLSGTFESCQHRHDVANAIARRLASAQQAEDPSLAAYKPTCTLPPGWRMVPDDGICPECRYAYRSHACIETHATPLPPSTSDTLPESTQQADALAWMRAQAKALGMQDANTSTPLYLSRFLASFIAKPEAAQRETPPACTRCGGRTLKACGAAECPNRQPEETR